MFIGGKMMENLCDTCGTNQHCCTRLDGLMLTKDEYETRFRRHEENLLVQQSGGFYRVTPRDGAACPNWDHGGCAIYLNRPIDCRLFPYMMVRVDKGKGPLKILLKTSSLCPKVDAAGVLMPETEARALATEFWRKIAGDRADIIVQRESGLLYQLRSGINGILR